MSVLESSRRAPGVYERKVVMHARAEEIMQVCWSGVLAEVAAAAAVAASGLALQPTHRHAPTPLPPPLAPSRRGAWCTSLTRRGSMLPSASR